MLLTKKLKTEFYDTADLNIDGVVDSADCQILADNWLQSKTQADVYDANNFADINRDGVVDLKDFSELGRQWGAIKPISSVYTSDFKGMPLKTGSLEDSLGGEYKVAFDKAVDKYMSDISKAVA